jgi:hypothetical protein
MTIAGVSPDINSEISVALNSLTDVASASPPNDGVVTWNGTKFVSEVKEESDIIGGYLFANENSTVSSVSSKYDLVSVNSKFVDTRLDSGYGREEATGGLTVVEEFPSGITSGGNIYCQFQLVSGQFLLISSTRGNFSSSSSSSVMCWMDESYNKLGPEVVLKSAAGGMRGSRKILGYINTNTTTKVHVGFVSTSGHFRRRTENGFTIQIIRIGDYLS